MTDSVQPTRMAIGRTGFYKFSIIPKMTVRRGEVLTPCQRIELDKNSLGLRPRKKQKDQRGACEFTAMPLATKRVRKGLTNSRLKALAAKHRPPQSWYEENLDDL